MRVLLQRVKEASVTISGRQIARIGRGYLLLVGVTHGDSEKEVSWLADKVAGLRIFEDEDDRMNLDLAQVGGEILVVSQFTLYGDIRKGRRPAFTEATPPEIARPLCLRFAELLRLHGFTVAEGQFGALMQVQLVNDGPVTLLLERHPAS